MLNKSYDLGFAYAISFVDMSEEESESVRRWRNDSSVSRWMMTNHEISAEEHALFVRGLRSKIDRGYWVVKTDNTYAGVISLNYVNSPSGTAYLGIYANPEICMKGRGQLLMRSLFRLSFLELDLYTLKLEVMETNEKAIAFYKRMGFVQEGKLREFLLKDSKREDVITMGILRDEALSFI